VDSFELIYVGNTCDQFEISHIGLGIASPGVFFGTNKFIMLLGREQGESHWSGIIHNRRHRDGAARKTACGIAGGFSYSLFGFEIFEVEISPKPATWRNFESWAVPEVLDSVMRLDMQTGRRLKNVNYDNAIQTDPGTLNLMAGAIRFFQRLPLESADYYKRSSKHHEPKIGTENCINKLFSPTVGTLTMIFGGVALCLSAYCFVSFIPMHRLFFFLLYPLAMLLIILGAYLDVRDGDLEYIRIGAVVIPPFELRDIMPVSPSPARQEKQKCRDLVVHYI
jgi:hypothetical protein